jgi:hypothetical protein
MRKTTLCIGALAALLTGSVRAQDIAGDWQGTLKAGRDLRIIVEIAEADSGGWKAKLYSIDQGPDGIPVTSVTLQGLDLKLSIEALRGTYEGKLAPDAASIKGT